MKSQDISIKKILEASKVMGEGERSHTPRTENKEDIRHLNSNMQSWKTCSGSLKILRKNDFRF